MKLLDLDLDSESMALSQDEKAELLSCYLRKLHSALARLQAFKHSIGNEHDVTDRLVGEKKTKWLPPQPQGNPKKDNFLQFEAYYLSHKKKQFKEFRLNNVLSSIYYFFENRGITNTDVIAEDIFTFFEELSLPSLDDTEFELANILKSRSKRFGRTKERAQQVSFNFLEKIQETNLITSSIENHTFNNLNEFCRHPKRVFSSSCKN